MTRIVVEAVLEADVRVILSKGWSDRLNTKPKEDPQDSTKTPEERVREQQEAARVKIAKEKDEFPSCIYPISSIPHVSPLLYCTMWGVGALSLTMFSI
jgi:hypothetical protein